MVFVVFTMMLLVWDEVRGPGPDWRRGGETARLINGEWMINEMDGFVIKS